MVEPQEQVKEFIKSPNFVLPDPEETKFPTFTSLAYQKPFFPEAKEAMQELYLAITSEINNKVKEINFSHGFYESIGMISITDSNFIKELLYIANQINQDMLDISLYQSDLLTLRTIYLKRFNHSLEKDLAQNYPLLNIEYYSNLDYFFVFSSQIINVSAHEILDLLDKQNPSLTSKIKDLLSLISAIKRMINQRIAYEIEYHKLDIQTINEFLNQNKDLIEELKSRLKNNSLSFN